MITRRSFIGITALAFVGLQGYGNAFPASRSIQSLSPLVADPARILDLPMGSTFRGLSKLGETMDYGFLLPGMPNGIAAFQEPEGNVLLVRNHELSLVMTNIGSSEDNLYYPCRFAAMMSHDAEEDGQAPYLVGTINLEFDPATGEAVFQFLCLTSGSRNCEGGSMPWGSWITCEEPKELTTPRRRNYGWCVEVEATTTPGLQNTVPPKSLGRLRHEAVALDPIAGFFLCLTEGGEMGAIWIDLEETDAPMGDLRIRGHADGSARFAWGEEIKYMPDGKWLSVNLQGNGLDTAIIEPWRKVVKNA